MCHGQLLSQSMIKAARKRHQCDCCLKHVERGMSYIKAVAVVDGDMQSSKVCPRCQAMLEAYYEECSYPDDYCFSLQDLRSIVKDMINNTGTWAKFKATLRRKLKTVGRNGAWHT